MTCFIFDLSFKCHSYFFDASGKHITCTSLAADSIIPKLDLPKPFPLSKQILVFTNMNNRRVCLEFSCLSPESIHAEILRRKELEIESPEKISGYITDEGLIKCIQIMDLDNNKSAYFSIDPIDYRGIWEFLADDTSYIESQTDLTNLFTSDSTQPNSVKVQSLQFFID